MLRPSVTGKELSLAPRMSALANWAPISFAPLKSAMRRSAVRRSAPERSQPSRWAALQVHAEHDRARCAQGGRAAGRPGMASRGNRRHARRWVVPLQSAGLAPQFVVADDRLERLVVDEHLGRWCAHHLRHLGPGHHRLVDFGAGDHRVSQRSAAQVGAAELGACQVGPVEIGARQSRAPFIMALERSASRKSATAAEAPLILAPCRLAPARMAWSSSPARFSCRST